MASGNEEPLLLGIDLGSTSTKAVIYDPEGRAVASESVPTVTHYPRPLWAYYEPEELWQGVVAAIRSAIEKIDSPSRVASVAVASFAEAGVPIDEEDTPTYPMIAWFDRRTLPQMEWLAETIGEERLFQTTGLSLLPIFSLNKLLWIRENEQSAWRRTVRWLMAADYIAYRLCGERATDYSLASRSLVFNLAELNWDKTVLERVGMPPDLFAPAVLAGTRLGNVTRRAAEETGLTVDTVVGAGGHDHVCGSFAAGVTGRGQLLDSMGTAEALFVAQERPITDPALGQLGYTQGAHVVPDTYYTYGTVITSGASVEWLRSILGAIDHVALIDEASAIPAGSYGATFVPHLRLADAPHPDSKARGAFIGLTTDASRPAIMRALYEGLAYEARAAVEPLIRFADLGAIPETKLIGGSTRNELLVQIKASVMNAPLHVIDVDEATALGAAMLGGIAAGIHSGGKAAQDSLTLTSRVVNPDPEAAEFYDRFYRDVYIHTYSALTPLNHAIHDLVVDPGLSSKLH